VERETLRDAFAKDHAMGLQPPEEIAAIAVFLASDEASSLTGAVITCDRGWTAFKRPGVLAGPGGAGGRPSATAAGSPRPRRAGDPDRAALTPAPAPRA